MNRIILLKSKVKELETAYYQHRDLMNTAKSRLEWTKDQLERAEAKMKCDFCKNPIKDGEPYISDRNYNYCCNDCKSDADVREVNSMQRWESDYQDGKLK